MISVGRNAVRSMAVSSRLCFTRYAAYSQNTHIKVVAGSHEFQTSVVFPDHVDAATFLSQCPLDEYKASFEKNGFVHIPDLLEKELVDVYSKLYNEFLDGTIDAHSHRHDLGSHVDRTNDSENICQIMWPSDYVEHLVQGPLHQRAALLSRALCGDDFEFDFDMLIAKAPHTGEVPWHQDEAYWFNMPDKRAISYWVAIDDASVANGCMWFSPGSHSRELQHHKPASEGHHILTCSAIPDTQIAVPLRRGSCTIHHGRTLHRTGPNTTSYYRRAYIANFRPETMIDLCRSEGFDHGRGGLDSDKFKQDVHKKAF